MYTTAWADNTPVIVGDYLYAAYGIITTGVYAVGSDGIIALWNGSFWSDESPPGFDTSIFLDVHGYLENPDFVPPTEADPKYGIGLYGKKPTPYGSPETGPLVRNQDPAPDSTDNTQDTPIELEVNGVVFPTDPDTVVIRINSVVAWENDEPQNGYTGYKTNSMNGFRYHLEAPGLFAGNSQPVIEINAADVNGSIIR